MAKGLAISVIDGDFKSQKTYTLNEAIEETKHGKYQNFLIILTGIALFGSTLENVNISAVLSYIKCDLNLTTTEQGILTSISFFGTMCTSHLWGFLADTWGRQKVIRIAGFSGFIFSFISAFSINTPILIILRFLAGASLAGVNAASMSYISEFHTIKRSRIATALVSIFISAVGIYASLAGIVIIPMDWTIPLSIFDFKPWRLFLISNSLVNLLSGIIFSNLPESPKFLLLKNRKEEALHVLSKIYAINTGGSKEDYPVKDIAITSSNDNENRNQGCNFVQSIWTQTKPIFRAPYLANTWKLCFIVLVIFTIGNGLFMWFTDFMTQIRNNVGPEKTLCEIVGGKRDAEMITNICNINNKDIAVFNLLLIIGVFFVVISSIFVFGLKYIAPKQIICGWLAVSMVAGIILNFLRGFYPIFLGYVIFLSSVLIINVVLAVSINLYPTQYRSTATSIILMSGRLGGVLGSNLVGLLLEGNCQLIFYSFSIVLMSSSLMFLSIKTKGTPTSNI